MRREEESFDRGNHKEEGPSKRTRHEKETANDSNFERWRKLKILVFDGDFDTYSWVNKLERFFRIRRILGEEKLQVVAVALVGKALS